MTKVSHSAVQKYLQCSEQYRLHYVEVLRPINTNSAFVWGSAMDAGLNELLKTKMVPKPSDIKDATEVFYENWNNAKINNELIDIRFSPQIEYTRKDLDSDIFTEKDYELIKAQYPDEDPKEFIDYLVDLRYDKDNKKDRYNLLELEEKIAYNYVAWVSMARKAEYIIKAYENEVMPQIKRVTAIQKQVDLENALGDSVIGAIDFIAELDDGITYIIDNKSASSFSYYPQGCVESSEQLALYTFSENIDHAAYIVYSKDVKRDKRSKDSKHSAKIRVIKGKVDKQFQFGILKNFDHINYDIKQGVFKKLDDSKKCFFYGKPCPYFKKCWEGSNEGLIQRTKYADTSDKKD
jgi:hypothetical protein